ncbi:hypothetical protein [Sphaerisporangium perillae]|uniref:hypothetical protein n=1 Tax=Sphaerisporangium perillae TaxID=2935860 RepID=UPI00200C661E|nr:hypothetical protein [Sphaerisporangium perillae]
MSKITRSSLATAAATLAVAGGIIFTTGGAASAATSDSASRTVTVTKVVRHNTDTQRWDGKRWWTRTNTHSYWYGSDHGDRYRFDGHRFARWFGGKWKVVSSDYAHHHGFDPRDFDGQSGHGQSGHGQSGHGQSGHGQSDQSQSGHQN